VLDSQSTSLRMPSGRVVVQQGDHGREAFIVVRGDLVVERDGEPVATIGAGDVVGELALLRNVPRNATVRAQSDADVLVLSRREFVSVLDRCPTLAQRVLGEAATRQELAAA
jgi:CRP-like cAMP-binding protein